MKQFLKKSLSFVLVLAMAIGIFPAAAFAYEKETAAENTGVLEEEISISLEETSRRGEYEKHFQLSDGSYEAVTYPFVKENTKCFEKNV